MKAMQRMSAAGCLAAAALLVAVSVAPAATVIVNHAATSFVPADIIIEVGDTVQWNWSIAIHTVTSGTGAADPEAGDLFDAPLDGANPTFSFVFSSEGTFPYFCRTHELMGMSGTVTVVSGITTVNQIGDTFSTDSVTIAVGEAVRWVWSDGAHTVTSGTGPGDPSVGALFDAPLDAANPTFTYVFGDTTGLYRYFCRPHAILGMNGVVSVTPRTSVGDDFPVEHESSTWGRIKERFTEIIGQGR